MKFITPQLETLLLDYIKQTYLPKRYGKIRPDAGFTPQDLKFFAKGAGELSDSFTSERKRLPKNYFNKKENRSAYLLYFTLTNFAKMIKCLDEAFKHQATIHSDYKILDVGCGPGTASLACSDFFSHRFPDTRLNILGMDQNIEIVKDARRLFKMLGGAKHTFEAYSETLNPRMISALKKHGLFDMIVLANVLNELGGTMDQYKFCLSLIKQCLKPGGIIIILDPALRLTTRTLMEIRDLFLINHPDLEILSPCPHQDPCPMLSQNKRDWCHFYLEWHSPNVIREVDRLLGIKHDYLKMAYLIIKLKADSHSTSRPPIALWRVVSSPLRSKGKMEFVLCGMGCLRRIRRLDRDRKVSNKIFDYVKRGDLVSLTKETQIKLSEPFSALHF